MNAPFRAPRRESMRIAGRLVTTDDVVEVRNPYDGAVVGAVPAARPEHAREAFAKAKSFKSKLSRYERQKFLQKTAVVEAMKSFTNVRTYSLPWQG